MRREHDVGVVFDALTVIDGPDSDEGVDAVALTLHRAPRIVCLKRATGTAVPYLEHEYLFC